MEMTFFFFFFSVGSCYCWKNWPAGTEFLLCVTDHLPRPDSFWILRVQNPNAGRPRLNLSLVALPNFPHIPNKNPKNWIHLGQKWCPFWGHHHKSHHEVSSNLLHWLMQRIRIGYWNFLSVSSPAEGQEMPGLGVLFQLGAFWQHRHQARSCLPFPVSLPAPLRVGFDLFGGEVGARWGFFSLSQFDSEVNSEENSSQQPPGMCGGGWSSGWFFHKVFPGFWFGNPKFKWKIGDWDKIDLRPNSSWFCFHKPQTTLVCSSQKWGRNPPKLSPDPSSKSFWCSR